MNADFNVTKEVKKFLPDKKETTEGLKIGDDRISEMGMG